MSKARMVALAESLPLRCWTAILEAGITICLLDLNYSVHQYVDHSCCIQVVTCVL